MAAGAVDPQLGHLNQQRVIREVEPKVHELLEQIGEQFGRYGHVHPGIDEHANEDHSWSITIGPKDKGAQVHVIMQYEPDDDGGLVQFRLEARSRSDRLHTVDGGWQPPEHAARTWYRFGWRAWGHQPHIRLAIIRATKCTRCGAQEYACHNNEALYGQLRCCRVCEHPVQIRREESNDRDNAPAQRHHDQGRDRRDARQPGEGD